MVCTHVAYRIYSDDANATWEATFEAVSQFLTFHRQKGIDPYGEAHGGPLAGHTPVAAKSAQFVGEFKGSTAKRSMTPSRDGNGRFNKSQKTSNTETFSQSRRTSTSSTLYSTSTPDKSKPRSEVLCTRCWKTNAGHNFRNCPETKCICGQLLAANQPICFKYDNHPANAKLIDPVQEALARILEACKRGASGAASHDPPEQGEAHDHEKQVPGRSSSCGRVGRRGVGQQRSHWGEPRTAMPDWSRRAPLSACVASSSTSARLDSGAEATLLRESTVRSHGQHTSPRRTTTIMFGNGQSSQTHQQAQLGHWRR